MQESLELIDDIENIEIIPREALSGRHTIAFRLYYKCNNGEKIKYIDYTSIYPLKILNLSERSCRDNNGKL